MGKKKKNVSSEQLTAEERREAMLNSIMAIQKRENASIGKRQQDLAFLTIAKKAKGS